MTDSSLSPCLTPPQVADRYGVDPSKVRNWITSGELAAINVADKNSRRPRWRVSPEALERFERGRMVVPPNPKPKRQPRQKKKADGYVHYV